MPPLDGLPPPLRRRLDGLLRHAARRALAERRALLPPLAREAVALRAAAEARLADAQGLGAELQAQARARARLQAPFAADMTIDEAWRRHPGAPAVFASFHLPACDGCAVRFDETLEEASRAYDLDLAALLAALRALVGRDGARLG